jgi:hypothetical protein
MDKISVGERTQAWLMEKFLPTYMRYYTWRVARMRRTHKCLWRCYRDGGGGQLITPRPMTETRAVAWVSNVANAEVFHVDFEHRMIFYRTAGK